MARKISDDPFSGAQSLMHIKKRMEWPRKRKIYLGMPNMISNLETISSREPVQPAVPE